jgi:acetyl-CoA carboxylase biotin carboxyl carrier protein
MTGDGVFELRAPMVGKIVEVLVEPGARVAADDELIIMESMKMEIPIQAPRAGVVRELRVSAGDTVQEEDVLLTLT